MNAPRLHAALPTLLLLPFAFLWIAPLLWIGTASLKTQGEIFRGTGLLPEVPQWGNFARAWQVGQMGRYFGNTVIVTGASVTIVVLSTSMIGYALGRYRFPDRGATLAFFAATVFLPEAYTLVPIFALIRRIGLADSLLGLILAESGGGHALSVLLFAGYFSRLPRELEEAALLDGAGFARVFWQVMLPLARPVLATAAILQLLHSWNDYLLPLVLTLSRPGLRTLAVGLYAFRSENGTDWGGLAAASTIALLPIILTFLALQRQFVRGIAGAIKE